MSQQERWDVVLQVLDGPLMAMGEQVYRGPTVRIGANPGPGGVILQGYRGLDARQCTITAYTGGTAAVSPVGTNQVRLAPHANVNWKDIDPITGPEYLSEGCALHIGPVNRGATLRFVECRRLGMWEAGDIRSDVADGVVAGTSKLGQQMAGGRGYGTGVGVGAVPVAYDARKVGKVRASMVPPWLIGCLTLILTSTAVTLMVIPTAAFFLYRPVEALGPIEDQYEFFKSVDISKPPSMDLLRGLEQPMYAFVMEPNLAAAGGNQKGLDNPENWDQRFYRYVTKSVEMHVRQKGLFRQLDNKRVEYAQVTMELRRAKLPEVFAAIPYQESRYNSNMTSWACAKGYWQFMPEVAHRVDTLSDLEFRVRGCRLKGRNETTWNPEGLAPPNTNESPYIEDKQCLIVSCSVDDRTDLRKSTSAAMWTLSKAWNDPDLRASGSAVQATILSHNAGLDDQPYRGGKKRMSNIHPALQKYVTKNGLARGPHFYGDNILCKDHLGNERCGSLLQPETQHYAYNIVAQHFLAVCYYAKEYGEEAAFEPWRQWVIDDSYCEQFKIPSKAEVKSWGAPKSE
ncbi:MAG: transglycosylase SLT domain-containing protein [Alphaproteobacteria bacterium]|nr:transglycosylase SLT domain-containing protein [Alphaproteobacteria bacterium]